jgi:hypothetical protein
VNEKSPAYQRYPKQIMGDDIVLLMDWDAYGMHNWLLDVSWQQEPRGTLPNDQAVLRRWLRNPSDETWRRVWPQISPAWRLLDSGRLGNSGMMRCAIKQENYSRGNKGKGANSAQVSTQILRKSTEVEEEVGVEVRCLEAQQIYELYPRKVAKPKALIAIHKAIEREAKRLGGEPEAIAYIKLQTQKFARSPATKAKVERGEIEFIPHPSTWFNQERFNDEADWRRPEGSNGSSKTATKGGHNLEILKRSLGFSEGVSGEGGDDDGSQTGGVRAEPVGRPVIEMEPQGD